MTNASLLKKNSSISYGWNLPKRALYKFISSDADLNLSVISTILDLFMRADMKSCEVVHCLEHISQHYKSNAFEPLKEVLEKIVKENPSYFTKMEMESLVKMGFVTTSCADQINPLQVPMLHIDRIIKRIFFSKTLTRVRPLKNTKT